MDVRQTDGRTDGGSDGNISRNIHKTTQDQGINEELARHAMIKTGKGGGLGGLGGSVYIGPVVEGVVCVCVCVCVWVCVCVCVRDAWFGIWVCVCVGGGCW